MLKPEPGNDGKNNARHKAATQRRGKAKAVADSRKPILTTNNGEIRDYDGVWPTNFHKGIPHNCYGIPDPKAFGDFQEKLSNKGVAAGEYARFDVALGPSNAPGNNKGGRKKGFKAVTTFHSLIPDNEKKPEKAEKRVKVRNWESPLAGHAYDLEGPDAGDVGMAAAPALGDDELLAEMAEVYALAALRDTPFETWSNPKNPVIFGDDHYGKSIPGPIGGIVEDLKRLDFFKNYKKEAKPRTPRDRRRLARRGKNEDLTLNSMFRGSAPGSMVGPYLSQFMLIGTGGEKGMGGMPDDGAKDVRHSCPMGVGMDGKEPLRAEDGYIGYGAQRIDQRIRAQQPGLDHMTDWTLWLDVQNGAKVNGLDKFDQDGRPRFINTPRDLATYVHFDQLYQAYLNACLLMLEYKLPFDQGMPSGNGHTTRGSFATFGGPHVLALMTEVSSRALKAVRRQKFQHHLRGRPEQLAAMLTLALHKPKKLGTAGALAKKAIAKFIDRAPNIESMIIARNKEQNKARIASHAEESEKEKIYPTLLEGVEDCGFTLDEDKNYLLPMAFPEGSPMHATYGAGHATVAGACVTVLKAFFEMSASEIEIPDGEVNLDQPLPLSQTKSEKWWKAASLGKRFMLKNVYIPPSDKWQPKLDTSKMMVTDKKTKNNRKIKATDLTIEGELNKLAANISIGRNMAGVHFYTDYYDSLRMGERVAVGILLEQMATYTDPCSLRLPSFDGDRLVISTRGEGDVKLDVLNGKKDPDEWWARHVPQLGDNS